MAGAVGACSPWRSAGWVAGSAILFSCAFEPIGWWPLAAVAAAPMALAVRTSAVGVRAAFGWRAAAAVGVVLFVKWLALHAWLVQVTVVGTPALAVYCSLHDLLALACLAACARTMPRWVPWAVLLPLALGASEAFRAMVLFDGYPWFRWGHPLIEWPLLVQGADLAGEMFATMVALVVAGAVVDALPAAGAADSRWARWHGPAIALAVVAGAVGYGWWRLDHAPQGAGPSVLAIQTNLTTSNKVAWSPAAQIRDVPSFVELTLEASRDAAARGHRIDLAAWPETTLPGYGLEPATIELQESNGWFPGNRFLQLVTLVHARVGVPVLVGSPVFLGLAPEGQTYRWDRQFNSAYLVNGPRPPYPRYDKMFLAPFGETMPYISNWDWLERTLLAFGAQGMTFDLDAGDRPTRFDLPWPGGTARLAVPICFEDAMTWTCRALCFDVAAEGTPRAADLMVCISNDGWFGWYDAGRLQHLQLSRFRCIENRTPMIRVANTGACAAIDSSGRLLAPPPPMRATGWLLADPPLDGRIPPFARVGEVASIALMLTCATIVLVPAFRRFGRSGAVVALAMLAAACESEQGTGDQPWSSRSQSIQPTGEAKLSETGRPVAAPLPVESSGNAHESAVALLRQACASPVPIFRANAVEALTASPDDLRAVVTPLLSDPNRGVRFVAAMAVGRSGLTDLADRIQPLLVDESPSVRAAAICALGRLGRPVDPTPLADMVRSDDPEVRSNAYLVLGELGNRSAVGLIRDSLGKGMRGVNPARVRIVELQASEALARLGETDALEPIRAALFAPTEQSEFTALAAQQVARLNDEASRAILMRLVDGTGISARPTEVRIGCALALAQISPSDRPAVVKFARTLLRDRETPVRSQAVLALGTAGGEGVVPEIEPMLLDKDPAVQLSAARALLLATAPR